MSDSDRQDVKTGPPGHPDSGAYRVRRQGTMIVKTHTRQTASSERRRDKNRPKRPGKPDENAPMLLNDKIRITPFARILPPLAAGIGLPAVRKRAAVGRRADRSRRLRRSLAHAENSGRPRLRLRFAVLHGSPARRPLLDEKADAPKRAAGDDRRNRPDTVPLRTLGRHDRTGGNVSLLRQTSRDDASPLAADRRENRTAVRHGIPCLRRRADGRRRAI